ncbi:MAG: winged helix-turn-helix domain-containing protein [Candidatus Diapherotrites archaeon]
MFGVSLENEELYRKIRVLANKNRFRILELTQSGARSVTELRKETNLAYTKCADYVRMLEKEKLVRKTKKGRETLVKSVVLLKSIRL